MPFWQSLKCRRQPLWRLNSHASVRMASVWKTYIPRPDAPPLTFAAPQGRRPDNVSTADIKIIAGCHPALQGIAQDDHL